MNAGRELSESAAVEAEEACGSIEEWTPEQFAKIRKIRVDSC